MGLLTDSHSAGAGVLEEQSDQDQIVIQQQSTAGHLPRHDPKDHGESRQDEGET